MESIRCAEEAWSARVLTGRINAEPSSQRREKQRGIRVIGAAIMTRDAGKCYIEFKETTSRNLSCVSTV